MHLHRCHRKTQKSVSARCRHQSIAEFFSASLILMKVLVISTRVPALNRKGDQLVAFHRIKYLRSLDIAIQLVTFYNERSPDDLTAIDVLKNLGVICNCVPFSFPRAIISIFRASLTRGIPFQAAMFSSSKFRNHIEHAVRSFGPDVVYLIHLRSFENVKHMQIPLFVDFVDSMALNLHRKLEHSSFVKKIMIWIELKRIKSYESYVANYSSKSFVVSECDKNYIDSNNVYILNNGVDFDTFTPISKNNEGAPTIIFSGNMNYEPNIYAVRWFIVNCWSGLKSAIPNVRFIICGNNPKGVFSKIAKKDCNVIVTGRVDSVAYHLASSWVAIAPMQSGSGMQNKILEAMSCEIPVVTTSLGKGSIMAINGNEIFIADSAHEFQKAIVDLLSDSNRRQRVGRSSREFVKNNHDWSKINEKFVNYLRM